jgi:DNA-binding NtrC family response regulator
MEATAHREADVLIVEDEKLLRWSLSQELLKRGYRVDSVASGEAALRGIKLKRYDVVITDLRLEGIDGLDVAEMVKIGAPTTRVVLITAYGTPEVEARARACGVFRFLNKPIEGELIASIVKEATAPGGQEPSAEDDQEATCS